MTRARDRLRRLERLRGLLAAGELSTVRELAGELQISPRTATRDLDLLRDEGFLIEAERGRGGGVRLSRAHQAGDVRLSAAEAIDVLISLTLAEKTRSPMLVSLRSVRQKIAATFARNERERIRRLRRRILIGDPASGRVAESYNPEHGASIQELRQSFLDLRLLHLTYRDERGAQSERTVEPQFLCLNPPAWYLLAWDHLRGDVRAFRFDRIIRASALNGSFRMREPALFMHAVESGVDFP